MKGIIIDPKKRGKVSTKRRIRKSQILRALKQKGTLSYTEIAHITQFSLPMVSNLIQELIDERFVIPVAPGPLKVGRPPNALRLNPEAGYILGIDIGHTHIKAILLNLLQEIVVEQNILTTDIENSDLVLKNLIKIKNQVLQNAGIQNDRILGTGVAIPGLVNSGTGWSYTYLHKDELPTREFLEEALGTFVQIENDVKAMALGESEGFIKIIYDSKYGELLGCHIIGPEATELITEVTLAKAVESTYMEVLHTIHPHPTLSEIVLEATHDALGEPIHI